VLLYRCLLRGENFPGILIGEQGKTIGFYTTRFVDAASPEEAEQAALNVLRGDSTLAVPAEQRTPDATVFVERIDEMQADAERTPNAGFTFFVMD